MQQNRSRIPLVAAAIAGLLLILGVRALTSDDKSSTPRDDAAPVTDNRDGCIEFTFVASSEKAALLQAVANDYIEADRDVDGDCVSPKVVTKSSGGATEALARGWDEARDGPRPDVWSPAASSWAVLLTQRLAARDQPDIVPGDKASDLPSVARTPLVFAMPKPMAEELGWPDKEIGYSDILGLARDPSGWGKFGHPEWGRFRLGKTNPNFSTSGLHATVGSYFAATGVSSDLTARNVQDPKTIAFVKEVEQTVVHYGDTTLTFLENLQRADDAGRGLTYISAATIEEKSVWDYNQGNPTGDPKTLGKHKPPRVPLVAVYPKEGTLYSDNPYVILDAPWVDSDKKKAAEDFLEFLQEDDQQRRFQDAAFRNFEGKAGKLITEDEVGLWIFSTDLDKGKPYLPLVPIAPMKSNLPTLRSKIGSLVADGGTGLYATARAATGFMRGRLQEDSINAVVLLTDGKNEYPADTDVDGLVRSLNSESEANSVRLFTVAYGEDADLATLKRIAEASRAAAYDASDPSSIDRVFTAVISNF